VRKHFALQLRRFPLSLRAPNAPTHPHTLHADYYPDISEYIRKNAKAGVIVEIGTAFGGLAEHLLVALPASTVHAVDPFLASYAKGDWMSDWYDGLVDQLQTSRAQVSNIYAGAMRADMHAHFGCRYTLHWALSTTGALDFADRGVQVIFIDGLHTYEGVVSDIKAWARKLEDGALIILNNFETGAFPGVSKAAHALASILGERIVVVGNINAVLTWHLDKLAAVEGHRWEGS
jgi:hypothetical protein